MRPRIPAMLEVRIPRMRGGEAELLFAREVEIVDRHGRAAETEDRQERDHMRHERRLAGALRRLEADEHRPRRRLTRDGRAEKENRQVQMMDPAVELRSTGQHVAE